MGAAAALMLAKGGAKITINYSRSATEAETTARACEELGGETLVCQGDVSNDDDCRRIVAETIEKWGRVDGLMNNAGTTQFVADNSLEALSADDFLRIYHVNVVGAYQMIRAVVPSAVTSKTPDPVYAQTRAASSSASAGTSSSGSPVPSGARPSCSRRAPP